MSAKHVDVTKIFTRMRAFA